MRFHTDPRAALTEGQVEEAWVTPNEAMVFWEEEVLYFNFEMVKYVRGKRGGRNRLPICQGHRNRPGDSRT